MKRDTLKITKDIIRKYDIKAKKRFGQNFLIDDEILEEIVLSSEISKEDLVIEIGPGLGNLTEYILDKCLHAILIEIDEDMIRILNDRIVSYDNFTLINNDILKLDINNLIKEVEKKNDCKFKNVKVVANLPYYITTPIIFKLLEDNSNIDEIVVMVQKEVAERMVAKPRTKEYGILTLMVKYFSTAEIKFIVPNNSFIPSPDVTSAVISLKKEKRYKTSNEEKLFKLIHAAFAKRRKKMINSLEMSNFEAMDKKSIEMLFNACKIDTNSRAEELEIEKFLELVEKLEEVYALTPKNC